MRFELEEEQISDDYYWPYGKGRRPGCESTNHIGSCHGSLWQCPRCKRKFCYTEGHADDSRSEYCDDCWKATGGAEENLGTVLAINGFVCAYDGCATIIRIQAGTDDEKKAQLLSAGWGPGREPYGTMWCCPAHTPPPHDTGFAST